MNATSMYRLSLLMRPKLPYLELIIIVVMMTCPIITIANVENMIEVPSIDVEGILLELDTNHTTHNNVQYQKQPADPASTGLPNLKDDKTSNNYVGGVTQSKIIPDEALKPLKIEIINLTNEEEVDIRCTSGHFIGIISAYGVCRSKEHDFFVDAWRYCGNKTMCTIKRDVFNSCKDPNAKFSKVIFTCFKSHALDCVLFHPYQNQDYDFCMQICLGYINSCRPKIDSIPRFLTLKCLEKLFVRNGLNHKCRFLLDSIRPEDSGFTWDTYPNDKYEVGRSSISNLHWERITFSNPIENPIVIPSLMHDHGYFSTVLIHSVTNKEFWARLVIINCDGKCREDRVEVRDTIEWLAISMGDHSSEFRKRIYVGTITNELSSVVQLPLDPNKDWIVLLHVQNVEKPAKVTVVKSRSVVFHTLLINNGRYLLHFYDSNDKIGDPTKLVTMGYIAFEVSNNLMLYDTDIKPFIFDAENIDTTKLNLNLPQSWPSSVGLFATTIYEATTIVDTIRPVIISLNIKRRVYDKIERVKGLKLDSYGWDLNMYHIVRERTVTSPPRISGVVIEDPVTVLLKRICKHSKRKEGVRSKRSCYRDCLSSSGLNRCIGSDVIGCYNERSSICKFIITPLLDYIIKRYVSLIDSAPEDTIKGVEDKKEKRESADNSGKDVKGADNTPDNSVSVVVKKNDEVIPRDCLEGPWEEWSSCSDFCLGISNKGARQVRKRAIYAPNIGKGSRDCIVEDVSQCDKISKCSSFCLKRKEINTPVEYFMIWSKECVDTVYDTKLIMPNLVVNNVIGKKFKRGNNSYTKAMNTLKIRGILKSSTNSDGCIVDDNWSACDAPCRDEVHKPSKYLRLPLSCDKVRKECTEDLKECTRKDKTGDVPQCFLSNTIYRGGKWVENGSCMCITGTPCTAEEIYRGTGYDELLSFENTTRIKYSNVETAVQMFISVTDNNRIHVPMGFLKEITYSKFKDEQELETFCATGSNLIEKMNDKILHTDCNIVECINQGSLLMGGNIANNTVPLPCPCREICEFIRKHCQTVQPKDRKREVVDCIKRVITTEVYSNDAIMFRQYKFKLPNDPIDISEASTFVSSVCGNSGRFSEFCMLSCRNILTLCNTAVDNKRENNIRSCMNERIERNDLLRFNEKIHFNENCAFKNVKVFGSGLIFCKNDNLKCYFNEWTQWSQCSGACVKKNTIPTRTRTRNLNINSNITQCNETTGTQEYEECLWLPQCPYDNIGEYLIAMKKYIAWEVILEKNTNSYESLINETHSYHKKCNVFLGQKQQPNTKLILQTNRCSCPPNTTSCSIADSLRTSGWFRMVRFLCAHNKMRSVIFNEDSGFHRYSCLSRTFIKEDFDALTVLCNENDGITFVSCSGDPTFTHTYVMIGSSAFMGAVLAACVVIYVYKRRRLNCLGGGRQRSMSIPTQHGSFDSTVH